MPPRQKELSMSFLSPLSLRLKFVILNPHRFFFGFSISILSLAENICFGFLPLDYSTPKYNFQVLFKLWQKHLYTSRNNLNNYVWNNLFVLIPKEFHLSKLSLHYHHIYCYRISRVGLPRVGGRTRCASSLYTTFWAHSRNHPLVDNNCV